MARVTSCSIHSLGFFLLGQQVKKFEIYERVTCWPTKILDQWAGTDRPDPPSVSESYLKPGFKTRGVLYQSMV